MVVAVLGFVEDFSGAFLAPGIGQVFALKVFILAKIVDLPPLDEFDVVSLSVHLFSRCFVAPDSTDAVGL